jgi:membrane fusion protein (multidrug efflux system)
MAEQQGAEPSNRTDRKPESKRNRRPIIIIGVIVLIMGVIVGGVYYWNSTFYKSTDDAYVEGHPVNVSARVSGNIVKVHVTDNQHVQEGDPLVEIDPCDYAISVAKADAAVRAAEAAELQASADIEVAKAELTREQQDLHRYEQLAKEDAVARQDLEHARAAATSAQATLNASEKRLTAARAQIAEAKAAADQARLQLSYTKVHAAKAGRITKKQVEVGGFVSVGQALLAIVTDDLYVTANFKETQLTHVHPGQPVAIKVDAYPGIVFGGRVDSIQAGTGAAFSLFPPENATGNFVKIVQRVPVKIVFDQPPDPNHPLGLGMSVTPKVKIK